MSDADLKEREQADVLNDTATDFSPEEQAEFGALANNDDPTSDQVVRGLSDAPTKSKGIISNGKKAAVLAGSLGIIGIIAVGFLMFMTVYKVEHVRNLLWDYRFARFHGQVAKRIRSNLIMSETYTNPTNTPEKKLRFEKTKLYDKLRGYSPEKAFRSLSELDIEVQRKGVFGLGENRIVGFTDPATKERIYIEGSRDVPNGSKTVNSLEFADRLSSTASTALEGNHSRYFQKQTRKLLKSKIKIKFGDRYAAFKEKVKSLGADGTPATPEEETRALREVDAEIARGGQAIDTSIIDEKDPQEDLLDDLPEPDAGSLNDTPTNNSTAEARRARIRESRTFSKLQGGLNTYSNVSTGVMVTTLGCIMYDLSSNIDEALNQRIEAPMRLTANVFGEAENLKDGSGVDIRQVRERNKTLEGTEKSAAFRKINGDTTVPKETELQIDDLPFEFFGMSLQTVSTFNKGVKTMLETAFVGATGPLGPVLKVLDKDDDVVRKGCSYILNPGVQAGIAIIDIGALFISLGSTGAAEGAARVGLETLKASVQIGAGVGFGKFMFEYALPKFMFALAGSGGILSPGDAQNGNKLDLGTTLLASQTSKMSGATKISTAQAKRDNAIALSKARNKYFKEGGLMAYFNPHSPYSLPGSISIGLTSDPYKIPGQVFSNIATLGASLFNGRLLDNFLTAKTTAAVDNFETYGVPQYGIPDSMIDTDPIDNAIAVNSNPGQLTELLDKYHQCFDTTLAEQALDGQFGKTSSFDYSICNDPTAQKLGLYIVDNCAVRFISEGITSNNCSLLNGAGDLTND